MTTEEVIEQLKAIYEWAKDPDRDAFPTNQQSYEIIQYAVFIAAEEASV